MSRSHEEDFGGSRPAGHSSAGHASAGHASAERIARELVRRSIPTGMLAPLLSEAALAVATGPSFFKQLLEHIRIELGVAHAVAGRLEPGHPQLMRSVAALRDGAPSPTLEYELPSSPCMEVLRQGPLVIRQDLSDGFPGFAMARALEAQSYAGVPLLARDGGAIGVLAVLGKKRIDDSARVLDVLVRFAPRASMEMAALSSAPHTTGSGVRASALMDAPEQSPQPYSESDRRRESLDTLARGLAHDFNNILVGIMGNVSLGLASIEPDSPVREHLERVERAAGRAADLTGHLLAFAGRGRYELEPVEIGPLLVEVAEVLRSAVPPRVRVELHLTADKLVVHADAAQIRRTVLQLGINAAEAVETGAGTVTITAGSIEASAEDLAECAVGAGLSPGPFVYVRVTDDGRGMDESTRERIFEPCFTTKFTGRGMGLAAVQGIVLAHRAGLRVVSEPGIGSELTLLLPREEDRRLPRIYERQASDVRVSGSVLVVDDEQVVRDVARRMLERMGFVVSEAADGCVGLESLAASMARGDAPRMVLLDMTMPRMGGKDTLAAIRRDHPHLPVVLMSGYSGAGDEVEGHDLGPTHFLEKPFRFHDLRDVVARALA